MESFFKEKQGIVVMVDPSGAARTLLAEVIRGLGFSEVNSVPGIKEAIELLEVEPVRWIVVPMMADQNENGLKLLDIYCNHDVLKNLNISFLLEESEFDYLPDAFERGLLSYHLKPFTKDSLKNEFSELFTKLETWEWNTTLLAGSYLRTYLFEHGRFEELLVFEKKLLDLFPGRLELMFNTVPALAKLERTEEALATLKQIQIIDPFQEEKINTYLADYLDGQNFGDAESQEYNFLGLRKILVVDSDDSVGSVVQEIFKSMGVEETIVCQNGEDGIKALEDNKDIDLIIQEWRIPKLTGPLFLQKAQEVSEQSIPVILVSSLIEEQDLPFVREMGVASHIPKPIHRDEFVKSVIWTIQQDRLPTEQSAMERKMRQFLGEKKIAEAQEIKTRYLEDSTIKIGAKQIIEAEFAYFQKEFEKARDFGIEAIKHSGDSIFILNLLGKTMMNLREFETALKCFEKAQALAPMNIERLCQIAEAHSEMGDHDKAAESIENAADLDPDSEKIKETAAKIAVSGGETSKAKEIMGQLKAMENVISYMNNQAVALARCEMVKEGIEQYMRTIQSIPDSRKDIKAIVNYNLALAHLRADNTQGAQNPLESASKEESLVKDRSIELLKKVQDAVKAGRPLAIQKAEPIRPVVDSVAEAKETDSEKEPEVMAGAKAKVISLMQSNPGDRACHLIFQTQGSHQNLSKLLAGNVRFSPREAIVREASGSGEKAVVKGA